MVLLFCMNLLAKYSTPRWNKFRPARLTFRKSYQMLARVRFWAIRNFPHKMDLPVIYDKISGTRIVNTYPYPEGFAPWPEDDGVIQPGEPAEGRGYTLVSDSFGFVVNRSTSYVAFKIYELTGRRLKRPNNGIYHAKSWPKLLEANGFREAKTSTVIASKGHYVGIIPDDGEFGQLLWLEEVLTDYLEGHKIVTFVCSTYRNFDFQLEYRQPDAEIIWYQID